MKILPFLIACNRAYDDAETCSIYQTVQYFFWRKTNILSIATVKYSMQEFGKPYYTKWWFTRYFTIYTLPPFYVFSNILDLIKAGWSIYQNVQYFIWSTKSVFNFTAVGYFLHKCSETILCLKRQFTVCVSPVFYALEYMEARKTFHRVVQTSFWSVHYPVELSN